MKRVLREPLVHFAVLGALLFAAHRWTSPAPPGRRIDVTADVIAGLRAEHQRTSGAAAGAEEEQALVRRYVDNEILYREALALGLDRGDLILRRRLVQKMEMLAEEEDDSATPPSDQALQAELDRQPTRYARPDRVAFEHVFVGRDRHPDAATEAERLRARLLAGDDPAGLGDPFLRGRSFAPLDARDIAGVFGDVFAAGVMALPVASWSAPLPSSYGLHLVRPVQRVPGGAPTLAEVRPQVERDLTERRRAAARARAVERLRARYEVRMIPAAARGPS